MQRSSYILAFFLIIFVTWSYAQQWDTLSPIPEDFTFPVVAVVDGKIHIMGGGGTGGATDHHFVYDPATDTWEPRAAVPYRAQQPAGAVINGHIHFFGGGFPNTGTPLDDHYVYDPMTDSWTEAAALTSPRAIHYAVGLEPILYSIAGQGKATLFQAYTETSDSWTNKATLPDNGFWYGAHVATDTRIYRFCGGGYTAPNNLAHFYDPVMNKWTAIKPFPVATHGLRGANIGNKIFLAGGYHDFLDRDEVYVYDIETDSYSTTTPMPIGRNYHTMVAIDSCLYVLGGNNAIDPTVSTQLIRLCPFEIPSATSELRKQPLVIQFADGKISVHLPEADCANPNLKIWGMDGQGVRKTGLTFHSSNEIEINTQDLVTGIYLIQIRTNRNFYTGKVFIP